MKVQLVAKHLEVKEIARRTVELAKTLSDESGAPIDQTLALIVEAEAYKPIATKVNQLTLDIGALQADIGDQDDIVDGVDKY
jgi:hypothetical protein